MAERHYLEQMNSYMDEATI